MADVIDQACDTMDEAIAEIGRLRELEGDAMTLRGFIATHGMTPSMMHSMMEHWRRRALQAEAAVAPPPLRLCGYCQSWHSRPCGENCCWSPKDPAFDAA